MSTEIAVEEPSVVNAPPGELTPEELEQKLNLQIVDVSHGVGAHAIDAADEYIRQNSAEGGIKGFAKRIWYGNLARDYYRAKKVQENRNEIINSDNLYALTDASRADHEAAMAAVINRFTSEYDLRHQGETNGTLEDNDRGKGFMNQVKHLVKDFAEDKIGWDALVEEKTRIIQEYALGVRKEDRNKGLLYADNIIEVAQHAKLAAEHGLGIDRIDAALKGNIGEARIGVRTEAKYEKVDKIVDKLYQSRFNGAVINEAMLVGATSLAMNLAKVSTRKAVTALGATIGLGVGAGVIAGAREHYHIGQERQLHMRQMAEGGQMAENSKHRESLENTRYETVSAQELIDHLSSSVDAANLIGDTDPVRLNDLIFHVSRTQSMVDMSDDRKLDFITFSDKNSVESERLALDIKLAEAKIALQKILDTTPGEQLINSVVISTNSEELIATQIDRISRALNEEISDKDRVFRKLRAKRTLGMAAVGAATGITLGLGFQEAKSLVDGGLDGAFTNPNDPNRHTLLAGLFGHNGNGNVGPEGNDSWHTEYFHPDHPHHGGLNLPDGYHLGDNGHSVIGPDGNPDAQGLEWSHYGVLTGASQHELTEKGFGVSTIGHHFNAHQIKDVKVDHSAHDFFKHGHHKGFVRDHRQLWFDNNTPAPDYDLNELRMDWGAGGAGVDSHGNYVFNVSRMTADGSFHDGLSANAQHLAHEGKLAVALSMTKDSQHFVKIVHIDSHGNAIIPKDSIAGQSMFSHEGGHAQFTGAYAETVQVLSNSKEHGVHTRMLATVVGSNHPHHFTTIEHHSHKVPHEYFVTHITPPEATPTSIPTEIPPVLPIYARRGLERLGESNSENSNSNYNYYNSYTGGAGEYLGGNLGTEQRRRSAPFAPELINNPDADIDSNTVTQRYFNAMTPSRKKLIENMSKSLDKQPKAENPKVVVMIPAAAHQEGKNIYRTLLQYANQNSDKEQFEVTVFANNPKGSKRDKTIKEIQRFQKDHPEVKVRMVERNLEPEEAKIGWVRKTLTDTVLNDLINRGVDLNEVLLVSNDADSYWINPKYISTIMRKAENQPDVDGFLGFLDWSYDAYKAHPEILVGTRLMQMMEIYMRTKTKGVGSSGANFVFRPRVYAAAGGYNTTAPLGEDVQLGRMIRGMRSGGSRRPIAFLGRSSEVNTSGRRALEALLKHGGSPAAQWNLPFGPQDDLRNKDFNLKDFDFNDNEAVRQLILNTEHVMNDTLKLYVPYVSEATPQQSYKQDRLTSINPEVIRSINFMFGVIGAKVRWQANGSIKIVDATKMIVNLRRWQSEH
jgi:hypothetical protein